MVPSLIRLLIGIILFYFKEMVNVWKLKLKRFFPFKSKYKKEGIIMNEKCCKLLKEVINKNYSNVRLDKMSYNDEMFYYEFKSDEQVSENDLEKLEDDIKNLDKNIYVKLIRVSGVYFEGNANNDTAKAPAVAPSPLASKNQGNDVPQLSKVVDSSYNPSLDPMPDNEFGENILNKSCKYTQRKISSEIWEAL